MYLCLTAYHFRRMSVFFYYTRIKSCAHLSLILGFIELVRTLGIVWKITGRFRKNLHYKSFLSTKFNLLAPELFFKFQHILYIKFE